jgi:hypothetical protein
LAIPPYRGLAKSAADAPKSRNYRINRFWHVIGNSLAENAISITVGAAMKFLTALLVLVALGLGLMLLVPILGFVLALVLPLGWLFIWLLPILIIACSDKTTGGEKLAWILAIVFLSWFAWIFYFLLAPIRPVSKYGRYSGRSYRYD